MLEQFHVLSERGDLIFRVKRKCTNRLTMSENRKSTSSRLIVAAIDIGTLYSGYAFSCKTDWTKIFMNRWQGGQLMSYKAPTALLLNPDKSFNSFGYEAEKTYADIAENDDDEGRSCKEYYFFHRFKMMLKSSLTKVCRTISVVYSLYCVIVCILQCV